MRTDRLRKRLRLQQDCFLREGEGKRESREPSSLSADLELNHHKYVIIAEVIIKFSILLSA